LRVYVSVFPLGTRWWNRRIRLPD